MTTIAMIPQKVDRAFANELKINNKAFKDSFNWVTLWDKKFEILF